MNDDMEQQVSLKTVLSQQAYMLFYVREPVKGEAVANDNQKSPLADKKDANQIDTKSDQNGKVAKVDPTATATATATATTKIDSTTPKTTKVDIENKSVESNAQTKDNGETLNGQSKDAMDEDDDDDDDESDSSFEAKSNEDDELEESSDSEESDSQLDEEEEEEEEEEKKDVEGSMNEDEFSGPYNVDDLTDADWADSYDNDADEDSSLDESSNGNFWFLFIMIICFF